MRKIIPCMDIKDGKVVKGVQFESIKTVNDPLALARQYERDGADVLVFYDITASLEGRTLFQELFSQVRQAVQLPLVAGGGIQTLEDARAILDLGADVLSINSGALKRPEFIAELAQAFGSDKVMLGVDVKPVGDEYHVFSHGGRQDTGKEALAWITSCVEAGAGSVVVNAIHTDGMQEGYDLELMKQVTKAVDVPVIASGGAGSEDDFLRLFDEVPKVDGALAASVFHFGKVHIPALKIRLAQELDGEV